MKKLIAIMTIGGTFVSCVKEKDFVAKDASVYTIRLVAIANDGTKDYTTIAKVKSGKVALEYETAGAANLKCFGVEISTDGLNFQQVKTIPSDPVNPNRVYRDTLMLE